MSIGRFRLEDAVKNKIFSLSRWDSDDEVWFDVIVLRHLEARSLALGLVPVGEFREIFCGLGCPLSAGLSQVALLWCSSQLLGFLVLVSDQTPERLMVVSARLQTLVASFFLALAREGHRLSCGAPRRLSVCRADNREARPAPFEIASEVVGGRGAGLSAVVVGVQRWRK